MMKVMAIFFRKSPVNHRIYLILSACIGPAETYSDFGAIFHVAAKSKNGPTRRMDKPFDENPLFV